MKISKSSEVKIKIAYVSAIILVFMGCGLTRGVRALTSKKVKPQYATYNDRSLIFVPMVHVGQKEFYSSLRDSLVDWKKNGYTVFYERVIGGQENLGLDSIAYDRLQRVFRRIDGGNAGTPEQYEAEAKQVFKKAIAQPDYADLGLDSTDVHADVTLLEVVNKIEELYGETILDSCDFTTHLDSTYNCSKGMKMKKLDPVYLDYRNSEVVEKITNSEYDKVVVLFGAAHIKGMKKLLKESESALNTN